MSSLSYEGFLVDVFSCFYFILFIIIILFIIF